MFALQSIHINMYTRNNVIIITNLWDNKIMTNNKTNSAICETSNDNNVKDS